MSIAEEVAEILGPIEIEAIKLLEDGGKIGNKAVERRLKNLAISNPKGRRPLTLYGYRVVRILKDAGRWKS